MQNSNKSSVALNTQQLSAINALDGPVLVVAGAGTGKTSVIVERINKLLKNNVQPGRILALTFTEKATAEMVDRLNNLSGSLNIEIPILTYNAYGESMLRQYGSDIGLDRNFKVLGDTAKTVFITERFDELELDYYAPISKPDGLLKDLLEYFSKLKQSVITPEMYLEYASKLQSEDEAQKLEEIKHSELAHAYKKYMELCREAGKIDYDDQIYLFLEMLKSRPNIKQQICELYDYVMIDEFQDTNKMQSDMIDQLISKNQNLFVVGDDDQSVYGWRGATLGNILDFKVRYPKAREITLIKNYRSTTEILDSAYKLIQHNNPHRLEAKLKINKKLTSTLHGHKPRLFQFETLRDELDWISAQIKKQIESGVSPGDIAVLSRRNETIKILSSHLNTLDVEHSVIGQSYNIYNEPAVRTILEAVNTIVNIHDSKSLFHTLTGPLFDIQLKTIAPLATKAKYEHISLEELINDTTNKELSEARSAIKQIEKWQQLSTVQSVGMLAYEILESSGYRHKLIEAVASDPTLANTTRGISELFRTMKDFEYISINPTAIYYLQALPALMATGNIADDGTLDITKDKVSLMTIHKSKGLEWPIVYIMDCTEGSFPLKGFGEGIKIPDGLSTSSKTEADEPIYEERRLMYVAMTRAAHELNLTYSKYHYSKAARKPSRFLSEAFDIDSTTVIESEESNANLLDSPSVIKNQLAIPSNILNSGVVSLNVSQITKYMECPLDFYYRYILGVPVPQNPTQQYGTIIHNILDTMNKSLLEGPRVTLEQLQEILNREWPKSGYMSANHRTRSFEQAQNTLINIFNKYKSDVRKPIASEEPFKITLKDINLIIKGRYDAIFPLGNGVEIVDYKTTTRVNSAEKAKSRASGSEQLTLYALAWQEMHGELPLLLTLDFVDTGQKGSIKKSPRGIDGVKLRLLSVADGIRDGKFNPGKDHKYCIHPEISN